MSREKILIVDDVDVNREILAEILQPDYDILQAKDGIEAVEKVINNSAGLSLVLLDIMMPEMDGYDVLETLDKSGYLNKIPVIIITAAGGGENEVKGLKLGAADFITKPFFPQSVLRRVESQIALKKHRRRLEKLVDANIKKVVEMRDNMIEFLASVVEYRDVESGEHVKRTRLMADILLRGLARAGKLPEEMAAIELNSASKAVALHDIGKIAIPDKILLKPGPLTREEFEIIKTHTTLGAKMIENIDGVQDASYLKACRDICLYHHERWDGKGYPAGKKGKEIPLPARVMSVVDVYDALSTRRVYKEAFPHEKAAQEIKKGAGGQFDPEIVEIFLQNQDKLKEIAANNSKA